MKLNIGAGSTVLEGYKSVDINPESKPDILCNIVTGIPVDAESVERILFLHTIEHIQKRFHPDIFREFHRILKSDGILVIAYPEFEAVCRNWLENKHGKKMFWEATMFGCQRSPADFHVCAMVTDELKDLLEEVGFKTVEVRSEVGEPYNTIVECSKTSPLPNYEQLVWEETLKA